MEIKNEISYQKCTKCSEAYTESQTDYVLPDYMADMRKILFTDAVLRSSGRFAGGETVEFSGVVVYNVIYLDAEGNLGSVEFTSDYEYSVKCSGDDYNDSVAHTRVSNYAIRLVGPRKISARASLVGSVCLSENSKMSISGIGLGGGSPELNRGKINVRFSRTSSLSEREYAESLCRLDGAIMDEVALLYPSAEALVEETSANGDSVNIKGKLRMWAILKNADETARVVEKSVPFNESVELEGAEQFVSLYPTVSVCSVKCSVNPDENGCEVVMSCILEYCTVGEGNQPVEPVLDGYFRDYPTENCYENMGYTTLVDNVRSVGSHNAEHPLSEVDSESPSDVLFLSATPRIERIERGEDSVTLLGEVRYSGVGCEKSGDKNSYVGIKFSSPFEVNVKLSCQNINNLQIDAQLRSYNCTSYIDQEKIHASCTLECYITAVEEGSCRILTSMTRREGEEYESSGSMITVYYPTSSDTLFSVAKRFHTSSLKVARDNDITEEVFAADNPTGSLRGVKKLIIY